MSEQDEPGYVSAQEIVDAMNARYRCGKEDGRQEALAQVREAAMFMHATALANSEPGEGPSFEDGVSSCALSILQRLGIDLEDKP